MQKYHEFTVKDKKYRCIRMVAKTQFHVLRKLLPLVGNIIEEQTKKSQNKLIPSLDDTSKFVIELINNLNNISDEDYDFILSKVLHTVSVEAAPNDFQNLLADNGVPMYEDLTYDLSLMLQIMKEVLVFNFKDFFAELPSSLPEPM
jgi:hypothetical protein